MRGEKHFSSVFTTKASISSLTRDDLAASIRSTISREASFSPFPGDFKTADMKSTARKGACGLGQPRRELVQAVPKPDFTPCTRASMR